MPKAKEVEVYMILPNGDRITVHANAVSIDDVPTVQLDYKKGYFYEDRWEVTLSGDSEIIYETEIESTWNCFNCGQINAQSSDFCICCDWPKPWFI